MKNLNSELNRILTLMEVKDKSSLPLLNESMEILNQIENLDSETKDLVMSKLAEPFKNNLNMKDLDLSCLSADKIPNLYNAGITSACAIAAIFFVVETYGAGTLVISSLMYAVGCAFTVAQLSSIISKAGGDETMKSEAIQAAKCLGIYNQLKGLTKNINQYNKVESEIKNAASEGWDTLKGLF